MTLRVDVGKMNHFTALAGMKTQSQQKKPSITLAHTECALAGVGGLFSALCGPSAGLP